MKKSYSVWMLVLTLLSWIAVSVPAHALVVTRGPYLQQGTSSSVIVRWRTDAASNSVVNYGTSPGSLVSAVTDNATVTQHEVKITGLTPNTRYY